MVRQTPPELARLFPMLTMADGSQHRVLQLVPEDRLRRILTRMFDPEEFLSDYGIRSISRHYLEHPYELKIRDLDLTVTYEPAESSTGMLAAIRTGVARSGSRRTSCSFTGCAICTADMVTNSWSSIRPGRVSNSPWRRLPMICHGV